MTRLRLLYEVPRDREVWTRLEASIGELTDGRIVDESTKTTTTRAIAWRLPNERLSPMERTMTNATIEFSLDTVILRSGSHGDQFRGDCCILEASNVATMCIPALRDRFGRASQFMDDHPSVSRVVRQMAIGLNDLKWDSDEERTAALRPYITKILGTNTTAEDEIIRAFMCADWVVRSYTPACLRLAGLTSEAQLLEGLSRIIDVETLRAAQPSLEAAADSADKAARDAMAAMAAMAARAARAARDAMAAKAARVARVAMAAMGARAAMDAKAARAAMAAMDARDAMDAIAAMAARAARDAMDARPGMTYQELYDEMWKELKPTALSLRSSAVELLDRLIEVGKSAA